MVYEPSLAMAINILLLNYKTALKTFKSCCENPFFSLAKTPITVTFKLKNPNFFKNTILLQ